jgi:hypothetical protein
MVEHRGGPVNEPHDGSSHESQSRGLRLHRADHPPLRQTYVLDLATID